MVLSLTGRKLWYIGRKMIKYRTASQADMQAVAQLHALSWQENYRGILTDHYLDQEVLADRFSIWQKRFRDPAPNQHIVLAEDMEGVLIGFACAFLDDHPEFGTLVDNLHVRSSWKGHGIGRQLMKRVALWTLEQDAKAKIYLWVLSDNQGARKFYDRMGGINHREIYGEDPGGGSSYKCLYFWPTPWELIDSTTS